MQFKWFFFFFFSNFILLHYISPLFLGDEQKGNWLYCSEPDWMTRLDVSVSIALPLSSGLFIAKGIHWPSWIVISTIQHMLSRTSCLFVCRFPIYKNELCFCRELSSYVCYFMRPWSVVYNFQGLLMRGEAGAIGWRGEGHIGSVTEINFSGEVSSLVTWWHQALTAPQLKQYTCCETRRLLSFVVQNTLNVGSSYLGVT